MRPKHFLFNPPVKLKSFKRDFAPMGFYFDIFTTEIFNIPVMPVPMRIDKLTNGESTFFIFPDTNVLNQLLKKLGLVMNFKNFLLVGIKNLINFAKRKYKEITYRTLKKDLIINWFENSLIITAEIPSLTEDYTFLLLEFLKIFSHIEKKGLDPNSVDYNPELIRYCETIINHFKEKIENNFIQIIDKGLIKTEKLYIEKKKKYFPKMISINITNSQTNKIIKRNFIPYLIYDDILDIFSYNKKILHKGKQIPVDMTIWKYKGIINKRSNLNYSNDFVRDFNLEKIDIEKVL